MEAALNVLAFDRRIREVEFAASPGLITTISAHPPMGQGTVRLLQIGQGVDQVDVQPCGGTHVARTSEIGRVRFGKIEKKGSDNRRVAIWLD